FGQFKGTGFGHDAQGFSAGVIYCCARLAVAHMFFDLLPEAGAEVVVQVIGELCQDFLALKHALPSFPYSAQAPRATSSGRAIISISAPARQYQGLRQFPLSSIPGGREA